MKHGVWLVLVLSSIIPISLWLLNNRFTVVGTAEGVAYKVDRWTGRSWFLLGQREIPIQQGESNGQPTKKVIKLPRENLRTLKGTASMYSTGYVKVELHNNTDWYLTRLLVSITFKSGSFFDEERKCMLTGSVEPYQAGQLGGSCLTEKEATQTAKWTWSIEEAYGYK